MVDELLEALLDKQELRGVSRDFAKNILEEVLAENPKWNETRQERPDDFEKTKEYGKLKSEFRSRLRKVYGVFFGSTSEKKKRARIKKLIEEPGKEHTNEVLALHRSTKERLPYYEVIYKQIIEATGEPRSILDLGCGYNPYAYNYLGCKPEYHAIDIACEDLKKIQEYLEKVAPKARTTCQDLTQAQKLPSADVTFCFKLFDSLEEHKRATTKRLLELLDTKFLVATFPTQSISGSAGLPDRKWFEKLITGKESLRVTLPNEQLYIITWEQQKKVPTMQQ